MKSLTPVDSTAPDVHIDLSMLDHLDGCLTTRVLYYLNRRSTRGSHLHDARTAVNTTLNNGRLLADTALLDGSPMAISRLCDARLEISASLQHRRVMLLSHLIDFGKVVVTSLYDQCLLPLTGLEDIGLMTDTVLVGSGQVIDHKTRRHLPELRLEVQITGISGRRHRYPGSESDTAKSH